MRTEPRPRIAPKAAEGEPQFLSLQPSPDMRIAVDALEFFRKASEAVVDSRLQHEERLLQSVGGDVKRWSEVERDGAFCLATEQEDAFLKIELALESFIRTRTCRTLGDLAEKFKVDARTLDLGVADLREDYPAECAAWLRSLVPWLRQAE